MPTETNKNEKSLILRPLLPKSGVTPKLSSGSRAATTSTKQSQRSTKKTKQSNEILRPRCPVCGRTTCKLRSHESYARALRKGYVETPIPAESQDSYDNNSFGSSYALLLTAPYIARDVAAARIDPFYDLPLPPQMRTKEYQGLFRFWLIFQEEQGFKIPRPTEIVSEVLLSPFMAPALVDQPLCFASLAFAAAARAQVESGKTWSVTALRLVGETIEQISKNVTADPESISDTVLVAMCMLWGASWYLGDFAAVRQQGNNLVSMVRAKGGLKTLGMSGAVSRYIAWTDIFISQITRETCIFAQSIDCPPLKHSQQQRYGHFWTVRLLANNTTVDKSMIQSCLQTAQLLEALEDADLKGISTAGYWRIFNGLGATFNRISYLQTRHRGTWDANECISLALQILAFKAFAQATNAEAAMIFPHMNSLVKVIQTMHETSTWQESVDMLIWLLLVALLYPDDFEEKDRCLQLLAKLANLKFDNEPKWPLTWKLEIRDIIHGFIWCENRFSQTFEDTTMAIWRIQHERT